MQHRSSHKAKVDLKSDTYCGDNLTNMSSYAYKTHEEEAAVCGFVSPQPSAMRTCPSRRFSRESGFAAISKRSNRPAVMRWFDATLEVINSAEMGLCIRTSEAEDYGNLWGRRPLWESRRFIYDPSSSRSLQRPYTVSGKALKCTVIYALFIQLRPRSDSRSSWVYRPI